jgi:hypothetical protein
MLDQITQSAKLQMTQQGYNTFINNVENLILQNASDWGEGYKTATATLNKIESAVAEIIESGQTTEAKALLEEIHKEIGEKESKLKDA